MAIFSAVSTDSEPEFVKNTRSMPGGAISDEPVGQFERDRVAHLERRRVFHGAELLRHRLGDFAPAVPGVHAPQARDAIEHLAAVGSPVVHALGARQQPRIAFELPIGGKGHPESVELAVCAGRE